MSLLRTRLTTRTLTSPLTFTLRPFTSTRALSTTPARLASDAEHYDPPSGWLFGVKPGEKYQKEGWETVWYWGFFGTLGLGVVGWAFKPDTS